MKKVVTDEEKTKITFQHYKNRLVNEVRKASKNEKLRFIVIEYLCSFPSIDPYVMAKSIMDDGIEIIYDDASISKKENKKKERKVKSIKITEEIAC